MTEPISFQYNDDPGLDGKFNVSEENLGFHKRAWVVQFGAYGWTRVVVFADHLETAIDEAADWAEEFEPGVFIDDDTMAELAQEYGEDEEIPDVMYVGNSGLPMSSQEVGYFEPNEELVRQAYAAIERAHGVSLPDSCAGMAATFDIEVIDSYGSGEDGVWYQDSGPSMTLLDFLEESPDVIPEACRIVKLKRGQRIEFDDYDPPFAIEASS